MVKKKALYKCDLCGNVVESLWNGAGSVLVCCGQPMKELEAGVVEASKEKHIPAVERVGNTVKVKVGSVAHPMTPEHYILFVEVVAGETVLRKDFVEGDTVAEAEFVVDAATPIVVRAYCNLHGLWAA